MVPWCIGCGLPEHDPSLFNLDGDLIFDDVAFDIDVVAARLGGQPLSTAEVMDVLGRTRIGLYRAMAKGYLPRPNEEGTRTEQSYWAVREIAAIVLAGGLIKAVQPKPCGTIQAYRRHLAKKERVDKACYQAGMAHRAAKRAEASA